MHHEKGGSSADINGWTNLHSSLQRCSTAQTLGFIYSGICRRITGRWCTSNSSLGPCLRPCFDCWTACLTLIYTAIWQGTLVAIRVSTWSTISTMFYTAIDPAKGSSLLIIPEISTTLERKYSLCFFSCRLWLSHQFGNKILMAEFVYNHDTVLAWREVIHRWKESSSPQRFNFHPKYLISIKSISQSDSSTILYGIITGGRYWKNPLRGSRTALSRWLFGRIYLALASIMAEIEDSRKHIFLIMENSLPCTLVLWQILLADVGFIFRVLITVL